uniref:Uncharacterized protein n=1 Tax=Arundo donax TaxID=35708 RepID=A0A0A8Z1Y8_ARUDO
MLKLSRQDRGVLSQHKRITDTN